MTVYSHDTTCYSIAMLLIVLLFFVLSLKAALYGLQLVTVYML